MPVFLAAGPEGAIVVAVAFAVPATVAVVAAGPSGPPPTTPTAGPRLPCAAAAVAFCWALVEAPVPFVAPAPPGPPLAA